MRETEKWTGQERKKKRQADCYIDNFRAIARRLRTVMGDWQLVTARECANHPRIVGCCDRTVIGPLTEFKLAFNVTTPLSSRSACLALKRSKPRELDRTMTDQLDPESTSMHFGADDKSKNRNWYYVDIDICNIKYERISFRWSILSFFFMNTRDRDTLSLCFCEMYVWSQL